MNLNNTQNQKDTELPEKIQHLFKTAQAFELTAEEKQKGAESFQILVQTPAKLVPSPYLQVFFELTQVLVPRKKLSVVLALLLVLSTLLTTSAYAAEDALPGDWLYPVKININENVERILAGDIKNKARVAVKHAITRLEEIEKLTEQGKITTKSEKKLTETLTQQSEDAERNIENLRAVGDFRTALQISSYFENSLDNHEKKTAHFVIHASPTTTSTLTKIKERLHQQSQLEIKESFKKRHTEEEHNKKLRVDRDRNHGTHLENKFFPIHESTTSTSSVKIEIQSMTIVSTSSGTSTNNKVGASTSAEIQITTTPLSNSHTVTEPVPVPVPIIIPAVQAPSIPKNIGL
jgi:Domain of unknown function (DUF5667)